MICPYCRGRGVPKGCSLCHGTGEREPNFCAVILGYADGTIMAERSGWPIGSGPMRYTNEGARERVSLYRRHPAVAVPNSIVRVYLK